MKTRLDIIISNFVIFLSLLFGTIFLGFFSKLIEYLSGLEKEFLSVIQIGILGSIFSFFTYGILVWPVLMIFNIIIEFLGLRKEVSIYDCKKLFLYESIIIALFAILLSFKFDYYYWLFLIPIVLIGQFLRLKYLKK
ncbi:hypothetical protein [Flavobacterium sp.]|uniref:hypothetical protein n=1 Tax=Flavobacterium sp. TaxID=239 RepID=UPI00262C53E8|nr:hypothetical protein [Flavobacterium sp.]